MHRLDPEAYNLTTSLSYKSIHTLLNIARSFALKFTYSLRNNKIVVGALSCRNNIIDLDVFNKKTISYVICRIHKQP